MDRIQLAPDLTVSRIAYGMWRLGDDPDTSPARVRAKIDSALSAGITTMDQADIYGGYAAEEILGAALRGSGLRNRIEIVTKCGIVAPVGRYADAPVKYYDTSRAHIEASVDHSLRLMGIEHIDLLLIHRPDPFMDPAETGAALDAVIASGKVRAVGVSNFRPWDVALLQGAMTNPLVTNQIELSLLHTAPFTNGDLAWHQTRGEAVMAWSPLGGGRLMERGTVLANALMQVAGEHGVDPSAIALAWLLAHPARILPVIGTNDPARITAMAQAARLQLDRQTWFRLYTAAIGAEVP